MKHIFFLGVLIMYLPSMVISQAWVQKGDFNGVARNGGVSFAIGTKGYYGTGSGSGGGLDDFWEYDASADTWTQMATFLGGSRWAATGFSVGSKGYIGTGNPGSGTFKKDLWEYDPLPANTWTQKQDFGGIRRYNAIGFGIGTKGYLGFGRDETGGTYFDDFWEYDPTGDNWTQKASCCGVNGREGAFAFSIGSLGYVVCGSNNTEGNMDNLQEYDPSGNSWTQKTSFPGTKRQAPRGFVIGAHAYIGFGADGSTPYESDFYQYDPATDQWTQVTSFPGTATVGQGSFGVGDKGYVFLGWSGSSYLKEVWEYSPGVDPVLPVELLNFTAKWNDENYSSVVLDWKTNVEINNDYFEVEKSTDGINYTPILEVDGAGNSSSEITYKEWDNDPYLEGTSFYRLKQVDFNGDYTYSDIEILNPANNLDLVSLYPNPALDVVNYLVYSSSTTEIEILVVNTLGQEVFKLQESVSEGVSEKQVNLTHLRGGDYILRIKTSTGLEMSSKKFVKR